MPAGRGGAGAATLSERYMAALAASLKSCGQQVGAPPSLRRGDRHCHSLDMRRPLAEAAPLNRLC
jgi:hypothetical protein